MKLSDKIKTNTSIINIAKRYIDVTSSGRAKCPFHGGEHLSLSFHKNRFKCFKCEASGSVIDFVMQIENITFKEALNKLDHQSNYKANNKVNTKENTKINKANAVKNFEVYQYFDSIIGLTGRGKEYLNSRGLSDKTLKKFNVKSIDKPSIVFKKLKNKYSNDILTEAGFINKAGGFSFYKSCVIFTSYRKNKPVYFNNRNLEGNIKSFKMPGIKEKWFVGNMLKEKIYLLEGVLDALSLYEMNGIDNFISLNGLITSRKVKKIKNHFKDKQIIYIFDNDIAGAKARMKIEERNRIKVLTWQTIDEDINDVYSVLKSEFKQYDKAQNFFNDNELERYKPYLKTKPNKYIKDLNDYLCSGSGEELYFGYSIKKINEIRKNINFNYKKELEQYPFLLSDSGKAFEWLTNLPDSELKRKILIFCICNNLKGFESIAKAI